MVYKHRMQNGKIRHYSSKNAYEDSMKGMFANQYQKKNHSKKINKSQSRKRIKHRGIGKVSSTRKKLCSKCKRENLPMNKGVCKECAEAFATYKQPISKIDHLIGLSLVELRKLGRNIGISVAGVSKRELERKIYEYEQYQYNRAFSGLEELGLPIPSPYLDPYRDNWNSRIKRHIFLYLYGQYPQIPREYFTDNYLEQYYRYGGYYPEEELDEGLPDWDDETR